MIKHRKTQTHEQNESRFNGPILDEREDVLVDDYYINLKKNTKKLNSVFEIDLREEIGAKDFSFSDS